MLPLYKNPLIYRGWRISFRFSRFLGIALTIFGLLVLALVFVTLQNVHRNGMRGDHSFDETYVIDWLSVCRIYAIVVLCAQMFLALYFAMAMAIDSVGTERTRKTLEFLITLPLSPADKVVGLALGQNLMVIFLVLAMTPLAVFFGLAGGISAATLVWLYVVMAVGFIMCSLLGVALSDYVGGPLGWLLVLVLLGVSVGLTGAVEDFHFRETPDLALSPYGILLAQIRSDFKPVEYIGDIFKPGGCHFFSVSVPWQLCPLSLFALLAVFAFMTAARKLAKPSQPAMRRLPFIAGFIVLHVLLVGFLSDTLAGSTFTIYAAEIAAWYLIAFYPVCLICGLAGMPPYPQLMLWAEEAPNPLGRVFTQAMGARSPNVVAVAILWLITGVAVLAMSAAYGLERFSPGLAILAGIMLVFLLANHLVVAFSCLTWRRGGQLMALLILLLAYAVPITFAEVAGLGFLSRATPLRLRSCCDLEHPFNYGPDLLANLRWAGAELAVIVGLCLWRGKVMLNRAPGRRVTSAAA